MGNEYRRYFWTFRRENLVLNSRPFHASEIVAWVKGRRSCAAKEVIEHLLKRTTNYPCRDDNEPPSQFLDDDIFFIQNIGSIDLNLMSLAGRPTLVRLLESSDSVLFRRYLPDDPLPTARHRAPTLQEIEELEVKYVWRVSEGGCVPYEENLENYIVYVLGSLEDGLRLYKAGRWNGVRCSIGVGRLDLWCIDRHDNFVVIELKRGQTPDEAIGQLARYMGWVEENYPDRKVRGFIICQQMDNKLRLAAKALRATVFEYEISDVDLEGKPILLFRRK